jgi:hypothetical protein
MRGHFTNHCQGTTKNGRECRWALPDGADYCSHHDPDTNDTAIASRAGRASGESRRRPDPASLMEAIFSLNDRASIQAVIDSTIRLTLSGHLSAERANIIMRGCSIAARNFDPTVETLAGPKPPTHDYRPYLTKVESILLTIDRLLTNPSEEANGD